jgi:hypothetical protein
MQYRVVRLKAYAYVEGVHSTVLRGTSAKSAYICKNLSPPIYSKWHEWGAFRCAVRVNELAGNINVSRTTYNVSKQEKEQAKER